MYFRHCFGAVNGQLHKSLTISDMQAGAAQNFVGKQSASSFRHSSYPTSFIAHVLRRKAPACIRWERPDAVETLIRPVFTRTFSLPYFV